MAGRNKTLIEEGTRKSNRRENAFLYGCCWSSWDVPKVQAKHSLPSTAEAYQSLTKRIYSGDTITHKLLKMLHCVTLLCVQRNWKPITTMYYTFIPNSLFRLTNRVLVFYVIRSFITPVKRDGHWILHWTRIINFTFSRFIIIISWNLLLGLQISLFSYFSRLNSVRISHLSPRRLHGVVLNCKA
jgi:hypothetical protein